jgi:hypothetical protein
MNSLEFKLLQQLLKREVKQGPMSGQNIRGLYMMIRQAAEAEFYEDNIPTLNAFLQEQFEGSLIRE